MTRPFAFSAFLMLIAVCLIALFLPAEKMNVQPHYDSADTAWMLTSTAFVLLMTPGLAFFYGGMVNKKNVISTMLQSFICMAVITLIWVVMGFSLAFGDSQLGLIGNPASFFMMRNVFHAAPWKLAPTIPLVVFAFYQLKFAIITPALITGAFAERIKFKSYLLFITLFSVFIYCPLAHATWHPEGLLARWGMLDFAGGVVVHMSAGVAALVAAIYLKGRTETTHEPARLSYVLLGTGLLWFGWLGFNAGSAFHADAIAGIAIATTSTASAAAAFTWVVFDVLRRRKPGAMGTSIGAVVGLVAITPAAGYVSVAHSFIIGTVASIVSNLMVEWRAKSSIDDTLDVFPCHGVGGMVGMLLTGIFAHQQVNPSISESGLIFGNAHLFFVHIIVMLLVGVFVAVGTFVLLKLVDAIVPLRVLPEEEIIGLDKSQHNEKL